MRNCTFTPGLLIISHPQSLRNRNAISRRTHHPKREISSPRLEQNTTDKPPKARQSPPQSPKTAETLHPCNGNSRNLPNLLKLCSIALQAPITCCLVNFSIIALQTLSIYCLENTSVIATACVTPGTPTTPQNTSGFTSSEGWVLLGRAI